MDDELTATGERLHLEGPPKQHDDWAHVLRYEWALTRISGRVLDVACGTGYGTAMLANLAEVVGADVEVRALGFATRNHPSRATYVAVRIPALPFSDDSFDCVVSFETVEHIFDDIGFLKELHRVLGPGGLLLLSTPNAEFTAPDGVPSNAFHVREYRLSALKALLGEAGFEIMETLTQFREPRTMLGYLARRALGVAARLGLDPESTWLDRLGHGDASVRTSTERTLPVFWVVVARSVPASESDL